MNRLEDGDFIEGTHRLDNRVIEGHVFTRSDGLKVVLQENKRWVRLSNIKSIRLIENEGLFEPEEAINEIANSMKDEHNISFKKIVDEEKTEDVAKTIGEEAKKITKGNFDEKLAQSQAEKAITTRAAGDAVEDETGGNKDKIEELAQQFQESTKQIKNSLRETLSETLKNELGGDTEIDDIWDDIDEDDIEIPEDKKNEIDELFKTEDLMTKDDIEDVQEDSLDYVDSAFCSIEEEDKKELKRVLMSMIADDQTDCIKYMVDNYELSIDEAEGILDEVYDEFLEDTDPIVEVVEDEVDHAYEDEIDNYEGDDILQHLTDVFEIPQGMAENIVRESKSQPEAILKMAEYTRKQLRSNK